MTRRELLSRPAPAGLRVVGAGIPVLLLVAACSGSFGSAPPRPQATDPSEGRLLEGGWTGSLSPDDGGTSLEASLEVTDAAVGSSVRLEISGSLAGTGTALVSGRSVTVTITLDPECAGTAAIIAHLASDREIEGELVSYGCGAQVRGRVRLRLGGISP